MDVLTKIRFNGENINEEISENTSLQFLWACEEGNLDKVSEILNDPKNEKVIESTNELNQNGFHVACSNGRYNIVYVLLKTVNTDIINATDKLNHQTGIHLACDKGYFDIVKLLLSDDSVDMVAKDADGYKPIDLAIKNGHRDIVILMSMTDK